MAKLSSESERRIKAAMKHPNILGAGAKKRKKLTPEEAKAAVFKEGEKGTLGVVGKGGKMVNVPPSDKERIIAIALSTVKQIKKLRRKKK